MATPVALLKVKIIVTIVNVFTLVAVSDVKVFDVVTSVTVLKKENMLV